MKLFHVSEEKDIEEFRPRYSDRTKEAVVWTIAEAKLANYLLPRNCPRVCFSANSNTSYKDIQRLGSSKQVVVIESCWYDKAIATTLYLYEMPKGAFTLFDAVAGYCVANSAIVPLKKHVVKQPIQALLKRVELRILPSHWQLHDEIVNSSLDFSAIRMKNARSKNKII